MSTAGDKLDHLGQPFKAFLLSHNITDEATFECPVLPDAWLPEEQVHPPVNRSLRIWIHGLGAVFFVSICAIFGAFILPSVHRFQKTSNFIMLYLMSLAVSALSGAALMVLIPEGLGLHVCNYSVPNFMVCIGIVSCFLINQLIKAVTGVNERGDGHDVGHLPEMDSKKEQANQPCVVGISKRDQYQAVPSEQDERATFELSPTKLLNLKNVSNGEVEISIKHNNEIVKCHCTQENIMKSIDLGHKNFSSSDSSSVTNILNHMNVNNNRSLMENLRNLKAVGWLCLVGDAIHNFLDGVAIGASFSLKGLNVGWQVTIAILAEEFPHELGDFAVLIKAGLNFKQAILCNLMSAATCLAGFFVGIFFGEDLGLMVFAWMGGIFLFISLSSMLPEVDEHICDLRPGFLEKVWKLGLSGTLRTR